MKGHGWPAQREMVGEKTCRAVVALLACGSRSMRAREAVSVRGGRAAVLRGSAPHERTRRFFGYHTLNTPLNKPLNTPLNTLLNKLLNTHLKPSHRGLACNFSEALP